MRDSGSSGPTRILVDGIDIEVRRKRVKNFIIAVGPEGAVRLSAPLGTTDSELRAALERRLDWIREKTALVRARPRPREPEYVTGEPILAEGREYRLEVVEGPGRQGAEARGDGAFLLRVRPHSDRKARERAVDAWYRRRLEARVPDLIRKWEGILGVRSKAWGIRKMRTRWGTCNASAGRIWLSLALAQKRVELLEYVTVHELVHLRERGHGKAFIALMDRALPGWRELKAELNAGGGEA